MLLIPSAIGFLVFSPSFVDIYIGVFYVLLLSLFDNDTKEYLISTQGLIKKKFWAAEGISVKLSQGSVGAL